MQFQSLKPAPGKRGNMPADAGPGSQTLTVSQLLPPTSEWEMVVFFFLLG